MIDFEKKYTEEDRESLEEYLLWAVKDKDFDAIKYLLTSSRFKELPNIHAYDDNVLKTACSTNQLEVVKYLLTSTDLKENSNIHAGNYYCIKTACKKGYIDLFKYLISSPDLKERIDIHVFNDLPFRSAFVSKQFDIIQCMIFEFGIEKTMQIEHFIESFVSATDNPLNKFAIQVKDMFDKRDLHDSLDSQLNLHKQESKKNKL